ncbi:MAG TPA: nickel-dependent lactate racemase [Thermodesulfobacteriota bacterium]|nr:nickel-dependent lactate racemase [Thermodesulfobacteriota bacterium]
MKFFLSYHQKKIEVSLSSKNRAFLIMPQKMRPMQDVSQAITVALDETRNEYCFDTFVQKGDKVVIIVSDITRYAGSHLFLPLLINRMNRNGIPDHDMAIVFSLGIHRPMTAEEQKQVVGAEVAQRVYMENHDARNHNQVVCLGKTQRGTPVVINRRVTEADKVILTGTIGYHYLAGFGGGRKSIIPGVASFEACVATHLLVLKPEGGGRHPLARTGVLRDNPMHEDMMEAARLLPPKFLFNTILSPDYDILSMAIGNWEEAFYQGCDFVDRHFKVILGERADLVVVSCGGYPKDINFIQAHKTFDYAFNALRAGGVMILIAACSEGIGNSDFLGGLRFQDSMEMETELRKNFQINGQTAYATLMKAKKATVLLLSELPDSVVQMMSLTPVHSMEEALVRAYQILGDNPTTYVIPYGSTVLPWVEGQG